MPSLNHLSPYCLNCYAPLPPVPGASFPCAACGHLNVKADRRIFWTQERRLREFEQLAKVLIGVFLAGISLVLLQGGANHRGFGMGQGWAVGFPLLFGAVLWETASKITRHKPYFRARIVWTVVPLLFGPPIAFVGTVLALQPSQSDVSSPTLVLGAIFGFALTGLGLGSHRLARRIEAWKLARIRAGLQRG